MTHDSLDCEGSERRQAVRRSNFNGLDYLEVSDDQYELYLYFLDRAPGGLTARNVRIEGGAQISGIQVMSVKTERGGEGEDDYVAVRVDRPGDFSTYTLRLVNMPQEARIDPRYDHLPFSFKIDCPSDLDCKTACDDTPPHYDTPEINYLAKDYAGFRQLILDRLSLIMPAWKERHVPDLGIALVEVLAYVGDHLSYYQDAVATEAYLGTARQRISLRRHARLVDYLMHEGHNARAWVHLTVEGAEVLELDLTQFYFITSLAGQPDVTPTQGGIVPRAALAGISHDQYEVFEPLVTTAARQTFYRAHNEIHFYTWGNQRCCLPAGATRAALDGELAAGDEEPPPGTPNPDEPPGPNAPAAARTKAAAAAQPARLRLKAGDILILEEVIGPETANPADANPSHRQAVRLVRVEAGWDPVYGRPVVEIEWHHEDALSFELCLSAAGPAPDCAPLPNVSVARGNVLLADHGRRIAGEDLGEVLLKEARQRCEGDGCDGEPYPVGIERIPEKFRPALRERPLVFSQPPAANASAAAMMAQDARRALPAIWLSSLPWNPEGRMIGQEDDTPTLETLARRIRDGADYEGSYLRNLLSGEALALVEAWDGAGDLPPAARAALLADLTVEWTAVPDLLDSERLDTHYVAEIDNDGRAHLRFGDGALGKRPAVGERFMATYRVGAAPGGNVGAGALAHIVLREGYDLSGVSLWARNPLPAAPALPPETMDEVRLNAPYTYSAESQIQRAVTAEDYAMLVERDFASRVQQAAAALRWTGHCIEALVVVDPLGGEAAPDALLDEIWARLNRAYRRIGHDLVVRRAQYVPLDIKLEVCAMAGWARGDVKAALLQTLGRGALPGGRRGFFHPDNLTFGGTIALSRLVSAAHSVPGVQSVRVLRLRRAENIVQDDIPGGDVLTFGPLEIPRLDNDPGAPQNGLLEIVMKGGK